eukprot:CAMPEP_0178924584 /NCGR_PEP_ID=MMETSP0786-20121207/17414_1 /TAXON_ID=186022 /ORGANISM="Thalassionema frauenfeldii, Strain CCMP 1798" /LENGTH=32 /DNA_ID= /DNA_START= /DNA_END= /DNA_ORIENTATION=
MTVNGALRNQKPRLQNTMDERQLCKNEYVDKR